MKKVFLIISLLLAIGAFAQVERYIPDAPNPPRLVNDLAHLMTPEQVQALEQKLVAYDDSTSSQIAIITVEDLHGYAAVDFATALGRKWGVGGKQNNGVVILVSTGGTSGDRDAFIAVGYGLEGAIPDITANTILQHELIPNLSAGEYYRGFDQATTALIQAAAGEYKAPPGYNQRGRGGGISLGKIIVAIIVLFFILNLFGGGGGRGGGYTSRRGYRGFGGPIFFPGSFGGGGGFGGGGAGGKW